MPREMDGEPDGIADGASSADDGVAEPHCMAPNVAE